MASRNAEYMRAWRAKNPEKKALQNREYKAANRESIAKRMTSWRLKREYNLSPEQLAAWLERIGNTCEICGKAFGDRKCDKPCIDHDHVTGCVRGIICDSCNRTLGVFGDDPAILRRAIEYLEGGSDEAPEGLAIGGQRLKRSTR